MDRIDSAANEIEVANVLEGIVYSQQLPVQTRTNINQIRYCEKCQVKTCSPFILITVKIN